MVDLRLLGYVNTLIHQTTESGKNLSALILKNMAEILSHLGAMVTSLTL